MKRIFGYVKEYVRWLPPRTFFWATAFIAATIFCNYYFGLNARIQALPLLLQAFCWAFIFAAVFLAGYVLQAGAAWRKLFQNPMLVFLLCAAPLLFAWKMVAQFSFRLVPDVLENLYWNQVLYWPLKSLVVTSVLFLTWRWCDRAQPFYGTGIKRLAVTPYIGLLVLMLPLLLWASTQRDFLAVYPKFKNSVFLIQQGRWYHKLLYELAYGTDFFTIELFFRGFLVLAFTKWMGKQAVLPMALFYCTIHFGKPLGECISSYFGGLILGAVTLHTRSIWGGLVVHLGIAWLMEVLGYFGHMR